MSEVSQAVANEEERLKKISGNGKNVKVNKLTVDSDSDDSLNDSSASSSSEFSSNSGQNQANNTNNNKSNRKKLAKTQKKGPGQSAQDNSVGTNAMSADSLDKMTAAFERMTASNAQLTAKVNILKKLTEGHKPKPPTQPTRLPTPAQNVGNIGMAPVTNSSLNPYAGNFQQSAPFHRPQFRPPPQFRNGTNRVIYKCEACVAINSSYCLHCFKCGGGDHKAKDCPLN